MQKEKMERIERERIEEEKMERETEEYKDFMKNHDCDSNIKKIDLNDSKLLIIFNAITNYIINYRNRLIEIDLCIQEKNFYSPASYEDKLNFYNYVLNQIEQIYNHINFIIFGEEKKLRFYPNFLCCNQPLLKNWNETKDERNNVYYYNIITRDSTCHRPQSRDTKYSEDNIIEKLNKINDKNWIEINKNTLLFKKCIKKLITYNNNIELETKHEYWENCQQSISEIITINHMMILCNVNTNLHGIMFNCNNCTTYPSH